MMITSSLDEKVRIWNVQDRKIEDWNDLHEMVTAAQCEVGGARALAKGRERPDQGTSCVGLRGNSCWLFLTPGVGSYSGEGDMATWQFCRRVIKAGHKKREGPIHWHSKWELLPELYTFPEGWRSQVEGLHTLLFLCRFNIEELSARGPYHVARVSRLDMTKIDVSLMRKVTQRCKASHKFRIIFIARKYIKIPMYSTKTKTELSGRCCSSWDNRPRFEAPPAGLLAAGVDLPQTAVRVYVCVVLVRSQLRCG
ncbi:uncharacterized protein LOC8086480 isoform X2 [Sorghum bicolor]|uniref:uncharacterized protein LOC8086480 isoform X2 n=1 Tax=Sorghum bicolor TaxID=4558 RepID=UPI000B426AE6|nr:uncharacterized protein LOC8086480 isoform X2 [Sorghum bicolor]|eukprot:XP_021318873.1 uncharacterized protein LOC8086480 isoform X2 [Sorghum bicolor]